MASLQVWAGSSVLPFQNSLSLEFDLLTNNHKTELCPPHFTLIMAGPCRIELPGKSDNSYAEHAISGRTLVISDLRLMSYAIFRLAQ